jgi:hypothetical protein
MEEYEMIRFVVMLLVFASHAYADTEKIHITVKGQPHENGTLIDFRDVFLGIPADVSERSFTLIPDLVTDDVCVGDIGQYQPFSPDILSMNDFDFEWERMSCKKRDAIVASLGATAVFVKGMSYTCAFVPLPQAQVAARVFDVTSYASASIGFFVSLRECTKSYDEKITVLVEFCEQLRKNGVDCISVDNTEF